MTSKTTKKTPEIWVTEGSGNVFADLGFANPEGELLKAQLTLQIYRIITKTRPYPNEGRRHPRHQTAQRVRPHAEPLG
jgi:hypothetical protein